MTLEDSLSVDEARARILADLVPIPPVVRPLTASRGLVLATAVTAPLPLPPFRNAAMDGYAVRAADTSGAHPQAPVALRVVDEVAAGDSPNALIAPGEATRIMTGAPVPDGADAVVRLEHTLEDTIEAAGSGVDAPTATLSILHPARPGQNVREAGEEVTLGQAVISAGVVLDPARLGLLAALGIDQVEVHRRPRVGILSTGDELAPPGRPLRPGQVYDANGALLEALVSDAGANPVALGIAADHAAAIVTHLAAAGTVDILVTSGGISAGDYDRVTDALHHHGSVTAWQVRMKPGKPLGFGRIGSVPVICLPGNPVAAAVSFLVFVRPSLARLAGRPDVEPATVLARLTTTLDNRGGRQQYVRATVEQGPDGQLIATPAVDQGSAKLSVLGEANALVVVPETITVLKAGAMVSTMLLERDAGQLIRLLRPSLAAPPTPAETK
jgi:molybdopterin molybdotransferase